MKKLFFLLVFAGSFFVMGQDKTEIEKQFREYTDLIIQKKFEKALDQYANAEFLKLIPKEMMLNSMNEIFNSKEMEFKMYEPQNITFVDSKIQQYKGQTYVIMNYDQRIDMKFVGNTESDLILNALKSEFGGDQVTYNKKTQFYEISTNKDVAANSEDLKKWKFTVLEKKQYPLLIKFIPEELLKNLK